MRKMKVKGFTHLGGSCLSLPLFFRILLDTERFRLGFTVAPSLLLSGATGEGGFRPSTAGGGGGGTSSGGEEEQKLQARGGGGEAGLSTGSGGGGGGIVVVRAILSEAVLWT